MEPTPEAHSGDEISSDHLHLLVDREAAGIFDYLFARSEIGFAILDGEFRFVVVNPAWAEAEGLPASTFPSAALDILQPALAEVLIPLIADALARSRPVTGIELSYAPAILSDPQPHWRASLFPLKGQGEGRGRILVLREQPDGVRVAEAAKRKADAFLRVALDAARMGTYVHSLEDIHRGRYDEIVARMFGIDASTPGTTILDLIEPEGIAAIDAARAMLANGAGTSSVEYAVSMPDGSRHWLCSTGAVADLGGDEGRTVVGVIQDITERKELELGLKSAVDEKSLLLDEMQHRVKNVLQMVSSLLQLQAGRSLDSVTKSALRDASARVAIIGRVYQDLYDLGERSHAILEPLIAEIVRAARNAAHDSAAVSIEMDIEPLQVATGLALPLALMVNEILTNSLKYAFPGGRPGRIVVTGRANGDHIELTIADDGVGFAEGEPPRGTGLGMTLLSGLGAQIHARISRPPVATGTAYLIDVPPWQGY